MTTYGASEDASIDCLKSSGRLDKKTHYMVDQTDIIPFAETLDDRQVNVLNKRKKPALDSITKMNATQQKFARIDNQADEFMDKLNTDQMAAMKGVTKEQEQFYSVGQAAPTLTRPSNPDYTVAFIWFGLSAFFTGLFFVLRQKRLNSEKNLREEAKRDQNLYEIGSEKRKEVYNIARILENSEFLNILTLYKMQKVNLTEAKDLLSTKFELSESDILLILKIV